MHPLFHAASTVVEFGADAPGRYVSGPSGIAWEGTIKWQMSHGEAASLWIAGKLAGAKNALLSDGSRTSAIKPSVPDTKGWRRLGPAGRYIHGTLELDRDDIWFIDDSQQPLVPVYAPGSLPFKLMMSEDAASWLEDEDFSLDLYGGLCGTVWTNPSGKEYRGNWIQAAEMVAQARRQGQIWSDFINCGNEGMVTPDVAELMSTLGWSLTEYLEIGSHDKAAKLVNVCEGRPSVEMPDWYAQWIMGLTEGDDLDARLHRAAFAGKVNVKEWVRFWELFATE